MQKLAESSGTVIYEREHKLYIAKKPAQWTSTLLFITGLLAFILIANGILQLFAFTSQFRNAQAIGITAILLGILFVIIFRRISAYRKKTSALPVTEMKWICIIDLAARNLLNGQQQVLASLEEVQLARKMQFTSSSPELVLTWPAHTLSLVEGNPFSGGIGAVEKTLIAKGIKRRS